MADEDRSEDRKVEEQNTGAVSGANPDTSVGYTSVEETQEYIRVHLDIEDAQPEDILVDVNDDNIQVAARMEESVELPEGTIDKQGAIYREIPLPQGADVDNIEASLDDGHLDLIIPKRQAET